MASRNVRPGWTSNNPCITVEYIEKVNCSFAKQVYDQMISVRYGIQSCCLEDLMKWDIKKQVLDYELKTIPDDQILHPLCYCYTVNVTSGTGCFKYLDCDGKTNLITITGPKIEKICSEKTPELICPTEDVYYSITGAPIVCSSDLICNYNILEVMLPDCTVPLDEGCLQLYCKIWATVESTTITINNTPYTFDNYTQDGCNDDNIPVDLIILIENINSLNLGTATINSSGTGFTVIGENEFGDLEISRGEYLDPYIITTTCTTNCE